MPNLRPNPRQPPSRTPRLESLSFSGNTPQKGLFFGILPRPTPSSPKSGFRPKTDPPPGGGPILADFRGGDPGGGRPPQNPPKTPPQGGVVQGRGLGGLKSENSESRCGGRIKNLDSIQIFNRICPNRFGGSGGEEIGSDFLNSQSGLKDVGRILGTETRC